VIKLICRTLALLLTIGLVAPSLLRAQSAEDDLARFFEGRTVTVKLDMPASKDGVDVYPDRDPGVNYDDYAKRIKNFGIALHSGDSAPITKIHVKDKLVEFQLGGGGYGTAGDESPSGPYAQTMPKSDREKELERRVKDENNRERKRDMQRELNRLRDRREREDARLKAAADLAQEERRQRVYAKALQSGSRFNIRFPKGVVQETLDPEAVMTMLKQYVDFGQLDADQSQPAPTPAPGPGGLRKGMLQDDVDGLLGRPVEVRRGQEGSLEVSNSTYDQGESTIDAMFVEGVLVRYAIRSK